MRFLKKFRIRNRIKLCEVARASGISDSRLSRIENGWDEISDQDLLKLVQAFQRLGVDASQLSSNGRPDLRGGDCK